MDVMKVVKRALKQQLPAYLKALPLPDTFAGFAELKPQQWAQLAPLLATLLAILYLTSALMPAAPKKAKPARFNTTVKLDCDKCVDSCNAVTDIEDSGKKVFCRCWKSKTFPYCDGSHAAHNKATGDNLGPLIVTKTKPT